ncbi:MAG: DUF6443 domain-containing protein [Chitinophagaceae bacterium]
MSLRNQLFSKQRQIRVFALSLLLMLLQPFISLAQPTGATISNPIIMGTYGAGTFTYNDTRNNSPANNFGNEIGNSSPDIFYRFTIQGPVSAAVIISHCGSDFDTYLHLLNSSGGSLYTNDDNGPLCATNLASISVTLPPGTYYIVSEGSMSNTGNLVLAVNLTVRGRNFIKTWDATAPETDAIALITKPLRDVKQTTQYFDGLGRPEQTVIKQGSLETATGASADFVSTVVYDEFGREQYKYLPFVANNTDGNTSINDGNFKFNPLQQQAAFMQQQYGSQGETFFYSKTNYEASPLNRVEKSMAPGNSWVGSSRGVEIKSWINTAADNVKIWNVSNSSTAATFGTCQIPSSAAVYPAGQLYKNATVDEHGKQVIEFKDKEGKVILKKVQLTSANDDGGGKNYEGWLCTYYIYDDLGQLRTVIQPEGVKQLSLSNWQLTTTLLNEQCFRYEYDARGRMIMKKVPGAGEVYMVYDARDRLVMAQDANMRSQGKWMITKYDGLNRPAETGLWTNGTAFTTHLTSAGISTDYPTTSTGYDQLTLTGYDVYTTYPTGTLLTTAWDNTYNNSNYINTAYNTPPLYAQPLAATNATKGMVTWTKTKVINTNTYLYTVSFYDEKGRPVQVKSTNITGGVDIITTQYSWAGQPLVAVQKQEKTGASSQTTVIVTKISYDDLGRLVKTEKKQSNTNVNGNAMSDYKTVAQLEYDKLGQLKTKKLAPVYNNGAGLETLTYDYNIRGWMLGVNRDYEKDINTTNYFGFELGYDKSPSFGGVWGGNQYNGNIAGMIWKSKGDGEKRKYDFDYDAANRLMKADFTQYTGGAFNQNAGVNFNMKMGDGINTNTAYDANGNIMQMQQWGLKIGGSVQIDNLIYEYYNNGKSNKLQMVADNANDPDSKLGDFHYSTSVDKTPMTTTGIPPVTVYPTDYMYDANGNMTSDVNKSISSITYNYLNLPSVITVTGKGTITYTYDAAGNKLKKETVDNTVTPAKTTTTLYIGGAVYENDVLQFMGHEEGRMRFKPAEGVAAASFQYDYMLKDHLGNVRMVLTEEQKQDKYPVASMETAKVNTEDDYYTIDQSKIVDASTVTGLPAYTNDNGIGNNPPDPSFEATNSAKLYKLNSTTNKTGLSITLKVMAGDKIDIHGKSYYFQNNTGGGSANAAPAVIELLNGLMGSPTGAATGGHTTAGELNNIPPVNNPVGTYISNPERDNASYPQRPKAFINYIFLDEQFKYVSGGFSAVNNTPGSKDHFSELQNLAAQKNGYVYIYVSNESPVNVFFDNLQVVHTRGAILEENHYYPFGLIQQGISSKALAFGGAENKKKYNGIEYNTDFDLNMYDAVYRNLDPQIGRFWQIDPKPNEMFSSYSAMQNNPIRYFDPLGDTVKIDKASMATEYQQNGQTVTGAQLGQQMVDEWAAASGLNLQINSETGMVTETGVATNKGYSKSARRQVRKMLGKGGMATISFSQKESSEAEVGGNKIRLGVNEIEGFIKGTPGTLSSSTMGYGMTAFHEWYHTKAGGSFEHSMSTMLPGNKDFQSRLDRPDIEVNKIRAELTAATGVNYGQRGAYTGVWWWDNNGTNGNDYTPMNILTQQQYLQMKQAAVQKNASLLPSMPYIIRPLPDLPK